MHEWLEWILLYGHMINYVMNSSCMAVPVLNYSFEQVIFMVVTQEQSNDFYIFHFVRVIFNIVESYSGVCYFIQVVLCLHYADDLTISSLVNPPAAIIMTSEFGACTINCWDRKQAKSAFFFFPQSSMKSHGTDNIYCSIIHLMGLVLWERLVLVAFLMDTSIKYHINTIDIALVFSTACTNVLARSTSPVSF